MWATAEVVANNDSSLRLGNEVTPASKLDFQNSTSDLEVEVSEITESNTRVETDISPAPRLDDQNTSPVLKVEVVESTRRETEGSPASLLEVQNPAPTPKEGVSDIQTMKTDFQSDITESEDKSSQCNKCGDVFSPMQNLK